MYNYKYHIFCCINERSSDNPKGSCKAKNSTEILDYFKGTLYEMDLKKKVRVTATKCMGACSQGPSVLIYPEGVWYTVHTVKDAREIIEKHILKGELVEKLQMK